MKVLVLLALIAVASAYSSHGQGQRSMMGNMGMGMDSYSQGLVDVPYIVVYDSKRDGPTRPREADPPGLVDVPYEVIYDSKRDGMRASSSFGMGNMGMNTMNRRGFQPQPQPMQTRNTMNMKPNYAMGGHNMQNNNYMGMSMSYGPQQFQQKRPYMGMNNMGNMGMNIRSPVQQQQQQKPTTMMAGARMPMPQMRQPVDNYDSGNLIDVPYIVEYDSKRDGPNRPARLDEMTRNYIDVPYVVVYDSKRDGPRRSSY